MKKGWIVIIVLVAILALGIFSLVGAYNDIATQQEAVGTEMCIRDRNRSGKYYH